MLELVKDTLQEIADKKGITKEELKKIIEENGKKDPVRIYQAKFRYKLMAGDVVWDSKEKRNIFFKNNRQLEKWKKEHDSEYCLDY